jgi:hypothetical protein
MTMAPMTTLRTRLIGTFLAVSVIALGGLGYVALRFSGAALTDAGKVKGQFIAERLTMQYDRFVSDIVSALQSVTHLPDVKGMEWDRQSPCSKRLSRASDSSTSGHRREGDGRFLAEKTGKYATGLLQSRHGDEKTLCQRSARIAYDREEHRGLRRAVTGDNGNVAGIPAADVTDDDLISIAGSATWKRRIRVSHRPQRNPRRAPGKKLVGKLNHGTKRIGSEELASALKRAISGEDGVATYTFGGVNG